MTQNLMKYFYKKIKKVSHLKGFTLLETLASVSILSMVIIGPLSVTISSSGYARNTKDIIVATYLAEEAVELLQNQYDSMYVYCRKNEAAIEVGGFCEPVGAEVSASQTAWRLFKARLAEDLLNNQSTCYLPKGGYPGYSNDSVLNSDGCAFDYIHMQATSTQTLERNIASSPSCKYLVPVATSTTVINTTVGGSGASLITSTSTSYVCSGTPTRVATGKVLPKEYTRSVTVDHLSTFEVVPADQQYNDDLRITSSVQFKKSNGVPYTVKVVRFMHARP